ncbi:UDP-N-acetylmuramoyl-L-alanyl-D-glutamate--2,6-diaminopimelate ligase [Candidatus Peregrinibacteria bacterium]|nr:UDP-N-acetylmuramoyl-L-alanyl-D-glutamate--2,6-diaminopimelate ligase [Candidatus Peregrinibacteria bacterium]
MSFLNFLRSRISPQNSFLLLYHKLKAVLAAIFYRFPANRLKIIAVTGTKGKSTAVHFIASILREAGHKVGVASTIQFQIGDRIWFNDTKQTTQGPFALQSLLREMVKARCEFAVIEITSHAMTQSRAWGINIDAAVLTNIQRDHIEYHGNFENYLYAKGLLFSLLPRLERKAGIQKTAVLPAEDPNVNYFETFACDKKLLYGFGKGIIRAENMQLSADGSDFTLKVPNSEIDIHINIPGEFNVLNALAAASAAISFGVKLEAVKKGLEAAMEIPGRLEVIKLGQPFTVVVDYAHTAESLEKLLSLFKSLTKGKLFLVFGATGGGRDKLKRPEMGAVADKYADYIVATDDDPYTEDRMQIINQVSEGIKRREGHNFWKIRDRRQAIRLALSLAGEGDTVIVAGKGCEPIQIIGEERIPWDDRKVVREILSSEAKVEL